ncbi:hypothetical protein IT157_03030 [bacterium]|nr:hypothetical protein [bacterium]
MYIPRLALFWATYRRAILGLVIVGIVVLLGLAAGLDAGVLTAVAALVGILTQAFSGLVGLIALIPWLGPLVIKALSIPLVWILNGAGYFFSVVLAGRGYGKSVVQSRILTVVLIVGIVIGFIIGKLVS